MTVKSLRDQHAEETRNALLAAARKLFAEDGYRGSGVDRIAAEARVTRGAVYHHFPSGKKALFRAVYELLSEEYLERVEDAVDGISSAWARAMAATAACLEVTREPEVRKILLEDAPNVLGWAECRAIDRRYTRKAIAETLEDLAAEGQSLAGVDVQLLADLVYGALCEASLALSEADDPERVMKSLEGLMATALRAFGSS